MKFIKKTLKLGILLSLAVIIILLGSDRLVEYASKEKVFNSTTKIPHNKVGVLLGTGKYLNNGYINLYYKYRINAAVKLFKSGKIDYILVSGDNSNKSYDEPTTIQNDLIKRGIPKSKIFLDFAGFRTLDSIVRCKEIFGQSSITVISQQFHNERAIYIAKEKDIKAVGFNAKDVGKKYGVKTKVRERFARVKMILDLLFGKNPKFLGEKIEIK